MQNSACSNTDAVLFESLAKTTTLMATQTPPLMATPNSPTPAMG